MTDLNTLSSVLEGNKNQIKKNFKEIMTLPWYLNKWYEKVVFIGGTIALVYLAWKLFVWSVA